MKILLTGSDGQLGRSIIACGRQKDIELIACTKAELDITDISAVQRIAASSQAQAIINAAAYTAVDKAESEPEKAFAVNALGPENLAKIARDLHIPLVHFSTDYIFNGQKDSAYREEDTAQPVSVYGKSKWAGEEAVRKYGEKYFILRVSWVFSEYGHNFVKTMLRLMKEKEVLNIVSDQKGCPTYAGDIAHAVLQIIHTSQHWGTYHYTGMPETNWHHFAQTIYTEASRYYSLRTRQINSIETAAYPVPAQRPANGVLNSAQFEKTFGINLQPWQKGLKKTLEKLLHD
jgi:dTDP-4-dehydrorhamnose reductase